MKIRCAEARFPEVNSTGSPDAPKAVMLLKRKIRSDQGTHPAVGPKLAELLATQYRQHPSWSYQLHFDNVSVVVEQQHELGSLPAYVSVLRYMKGHGLRKRPRRGPVHSPGAQAAEQRYENREIRSYESEYVNALWHLDFHSNWLLRPRSNALSAAATALSAWRAFVSKSLPAMRI